MLRLERLVDAHFAAPVWLDVGALACLALLLLAALGAWRRRRALARFATLGVARRLTESVGRGRRALKLALLVLGLAAAFVALARPRFGYHLVERERRGVDILFAVDTSRSMLAEDLRPNRLTRAKLAVRDLVRDFEGDRAGLVAFAGEAFLQCPMTLDRPVFERSLAELDTEIIPRGGTDLAGAIRESVAAFGDADHEKLLVLLSDGEQLEGDALAVAEEARRAGVRIFTVGVGSPEGALIPVPDRRGRMAPLRDASGELVRSALDEETLQLVAELGGGAYAPLGASGDGLARLYATHLAALPRHAVAARRQRVPHEQFQWPLGLAILLLAVEPWIGERRRLRRTSRSLAAAATALALFFAPRAFASPREAREAYERGEFAEAARLWGDAAEREEGSAALRYDQGAAAYRAGDWDTAVEAYGEAIRRGDPRLQQRAYYDLGNAEYRRGEAALGEARVRAREAWQRAVRAYRAALALDADDADARHNLALVRRRLAELEDEAEETRDPADEGGSQQGSTESGQQGSEQGSGQNGQQDGPAQGGQQGGSEQGGQQRSGQQPGGQQPAASGVPRRAASERARGRTASERARSRAASSPACRAKRSRMARGAMREVAEAGAARAETRMARRMTARPVRTAWIDPARAAGTVSTGTQTRTRASRERPVTTREMEPAMARTRRNEPASRAANPPEAGMEPTGRVGASSSNTRPDSVSAADG